jgi:phosphoglycolate/pyridoxal phosphate phosphatase family enzyme
MSERAASSGPSAPLGSRYRVIAFDCDGVMYLGDQVIPAAPGAVDGVRELGVHVGFVTNNSSNAPEHVAAKLTKLGIEATAEDVITSAQALIRMLGGEEQLRGVRTLVVGGAGLRDELTAAGAELLGPGEWRRADLVAVGLDKELTYAKLSDASLALSTGGARFVATNADPSLPGPDGPQPGAGSLLALLTTATGRRPEIAGKPAPALFETTAARLGDGPYLMVGDRADTDLAGAADLGWDTALVLSGVLRPETIPDAAVLPTFLLEDVGGLLGPAQPVVRPVHTDPAELDAAARLLATAPNATSERARAGATVVAVTPDGRVTGAVAWRVKGAGPERGPRTGTGTLLGPVVDEAARGSLTGSRLVMAACAGLRAHGAARVTAPGAALTAAGFLTRMGFTQIPGDDDSLTRDLPEPSRL